MEGVVTVLNSPHYQEVQVLWDELERECGLFGVRVTPIPHFSWQVAVGYDLDRLASVMQAIAQATRPGIAYTTGLGVFSGEKPVIYLPVVKDTYMLQLHQLIWDLTQPVADRPSPYYSPDAWVPHITLAYGDVNQDRACCALERLVLRPFQWQLTVNNIALISQAPGQTGQEILSYLFTG